MKNTTNLENCFKKMQLISKRNYIQDLDATIIAKCFTEAKKTGNDSIGSITTKDDCINACYFTLTAFANLVPAQQLLGICLHKNINSKGGNDKYKGIEYFMKLDGYTLTKNVDDVEVKEYHISRKTAKKIKEHMKCCDLSDIDNLKRMLKDINMCYRLYQELTIDAAKKLWVVVNDFDYKGIAPLSSFKVSFSYSLKDKTIKVNRNLYSSVEVFKDPYSSAQNDITDHAVSINKRLFEIDYSMSDSKYEELVNVIGEGPVRELSLIKYLYHDAVSEHATIIKSIMDEDTDDDTKRAKMANENARYSKELSHISIPIAQLLDGYDVNEAINILELIAAKNKNGEIDRRSLNQFATALAPNIYLNSILDNAEIKVMGYPVSIDNGLELGETYHFVNGICNGSLLDYGKELPYANGDFNIVDFKGRKYAVKDIKFNSNVDYTKRTFAFTRNSFNINTLDESFVLGSNVVVDHSGNVKIDDILFGQVPLFTEDEFNKGNSFISLIGVKGTLEYFKIFENETYGPTVFFSLDNVSRMKEEIAVLPEVDAVDSEYKVLDVDSDATAEDEAAIDVEENNTDDLQRELKELERFI